MTRFLSREEIRRLHAVLDACVAERPVNAPTADIIRLLLLTGCRRGEILNLQWHEVGKDILELIDSKTGPRTVFLSPKAKAVIERQPRLGSPWVFPSPANRKKPRSVGSLDGLWKLVRKQAGIEDVRLHDLRHSVASQAVLKGVPLPVVARLLGHSQVSMTLRYAHVADEEVEAAAEKVGRVIAGYCGISDPLISGSYSEGRLPPPTLSTVWERFQVKLSEPPTVIVWAGPCARPLFLATRIIPKRASRVQPATPKNPPKDSRKNNERTSTQSRQAKQSPAATCQ